MTLERGRKKKLRMDSNKLAYMLASSKPEEEKLVDFIEHVETEAMKPGAKANVMELYANLKGLLIKRQEVFVIDGSIIARAALKAAREREDRERASRVDEVSRQPGLLSENLRLPSGQGKGTDNPLRAVGTLDESEQPVLDRKAPDCPEGKTTRS